MVVETKPSVIISKRDLSELQKADIQSMVEDGILPSEIAEEYAGVPIKIIENMRRDFRRTLPTAASPSTITTEVSAAAVDLQRQMSEMKMRMQLEEMRDELDAQRQKRRLDIEQRRLDLRRQRLEMREDFNDYGDEQPEEPEKSPDLLEYDFENNPISAGMKFIRDLKDKNDRGERNAPQAPQTPQYDTMLDVTKPLSDEQINAEIARASPEELAQLKQAPDFAITEALRTRYKGITPENIKAVISRIRHYA